MLAYFDAHPAPRAAFIILVNLPQSSQPEIGTAATTPQPILCSHPTRTATPCTVCAISRPTPHPSDLICLLSVRMYWLAYTFNRRVWSTLTHRMQAKAMTYTSLTIRIPVQVAAQLRHYAKLSGWRFADLLRTMICIGATFLLLTYESEADEAAATLLGGMKPFRLSRSHSLAFRKRPYAFRHPFRRSTLVTLSLPQSFCDMAATYAGLMRVSRNEVYNKSLQQGLAIYLNAQRTTLRTPGE